MAINFGGYASAYGGGAGGAGAVGTPESNAGAVIGQGLGTALAAIPTFSERFNKKFNQDLFYGDNAALKPFREGFTGNIEDFSLIDSEGNSLFKNAGESYLNFEGTLDERMKKRAKRRRKLFW